MLAAKLKVRSLIVLLNEFAEQTQRCNLSHVFDMTQSSLFTVNYSCFSYDTKTSYSNFYSSTICRVFFSRKDCLISLYCCKITKREKREYSILNCTFSFTLLDVFNVTFYAYRPCNSLLVMLLRCVLQP